MSFADILSDIDAASRRKLGGKMPSWAGAGLEVPASVNLQQCSSEAAARHKASLLPSGCRVADLTGGLGADSWAFAVEGHSVWYNERDIVLQQAVQRNFQKLNVKGVSFNSFDIGEGDDWFQALAAFGPDVIYLDPARRDSAGKKVFLLEQCSPDVTALMPRLLELAPRVLIKVSPMADLTMLRRRLDGVLERIEVVGLKGECKELLCLCRRGADFCGITLWEDGAGFDPTVPRAQGDYIFIPSAAFVKSSLGAATLLQKLSGRTEIYRSAWDPTLLPFGSFYTLLEILQLHKSVFPGVRFKYPAANVIARDVPMSSEELRASLRVKQGTQILILGCSLEGLRSLLILKKVSTPEQGV